MAHRPRLTIPSCAPLRDWRRSYKVKREYLRQLQSDSNLRRAFVKGSELVYRDLYRQAEAAVPDNYGPRGEV